MLASSLLAIALASSSGGRPAEPRSAALACPDGGNTMFFKSEAGFQGFRMEGAASYRSLFVGESWEKVASDPPGPSGRAEFWVDSVFVSEKNGAQFWVATPHPRGAVVMTLIVPAGVPVERALKLIGSYIANFGSVDAAACQRIREEMGKK